MSRLNLLKVVTVSRCAILGASGHGKVLAEIAELNGYSKVVFYDDAWPSKKSLEAWPVEGGSAELLKFAFQYDIVMIAIGNNEIRYKKYLQLQSVNATIPALIHPNAIVSRYASIGDGSIIMAGAIVNPFVTIGSAVIVNTGATVDHDCNLRSGVHISPKASLAGDVDIGELSWVGIGAQVKQSIKIGRSVTVGAGSTVVKNIGDSLVVVGTPAVVLTRS